MNTKKSIKVIKMDYVAEQWNGSMVALQYVVIMDFSLRRGSTMFLNVNYLK